MPQDHKDRDASAPDGRGKVSRRGFLTSVGTGALGAAAATQVQAQAPPSAVVVDANELTKVTLHINGRRHQVLVEPR